MRTYLMTAIVLLFALTACGKGEEHSHDEGGLADKMLATLDKDGDKLVSRDEFASHFTDVDTDASGSISKAELESHHQEMHGGEHSGHTPDAEFTKADANGDGSITPEEFSSLFTTMDKDGNGTLMRGELLQHVNPTH